MPRVFVIEEPRANFDMSSAEAFGEVTPIFACDDRRASVFKPDEYVTQVRDSLSEKEFDHEADFVAVAGGLLPNCLLMSALARYPSCRMLMFSAHDSGYVMREVAGVA